jgi:hypothetical protein
MDGDNLVVYAELFEAVIVFCGGYPEVSGVYLDIDVSPLPQPKSSTLIPGCKSRLSVSSSTIFRAFGPIRLSLTNRLSYFAVFWVVHSIAYFFDFRAIAGREEKRYR